MDLFQKVKTLKTLLIDDNQTIRDAFQMAFEKKGCFLKAAESAEEGLAVLKNEKFDIIISDLRLPGLNGVEFFKRATITHPDTVRVLISGYGNEKVVREAFDLGVHVFLEKPFTLTTLLEHLTIQIEKRHRRIIRAHDSPESEATPTSAEKTASSKIIFCRSG
jgi:DNA-binding NtrC family response regulator